MPIRRLDAFLLGATASLGLAWGALNSEREIKTNRHDSAARRQPGVGTRAGSPAEIPAKAWWGVVKRVYQKLNEDGLLAQAAGVTFYVLLALFPALASLVSLYGLFADASTIEQNIGAVSGVVPGGGMQILTEQVHNLASHSNSKLGLGLAVGLATSLWSANAGIKAFFDALNVVYEEREKRGFIRRTLTSLAFTVGGLLFIILALGAVVVLPAVLNVVGLGQTTELLLKWSRWPVLLVVVGGFLAVLYRYGPSRETAKWQWVTWGSGFAAVTWVIASIAFSWYVQNFGNYDKTYGSLGAAVGFMTWIWLSTTVVLIGAELNAELEHATEADTTTGAPLPLGTRGAVKADTVAA